MTTPELTVDEAVAELISTLQPIEGLERVPAGAAIMRVLAEDIESPLDLPAFDNAAMDGYALRAADAAAPLREIGRALAGHPFAGRIEAGTCVRIMTGAPLPAGADAVAMMEDATVEGATVRIGTPLQPGANVRRRGEHIARGDIVLPSQRQLRAADLGLAAAIGRTELPVMRRLRVGFLSTGDELADAPAPLAPSAAYDANRPLLRASAERLGFETIDLGICADRSEDFDRALARALAAERIDALVVSGGAAQGDADVVRRAGGIRFVALNIRPGRGLAVAQLTHGGRTLALLGLPGNAVAAFVMFHLVARPVLLHLAGGIATAPQSIPVPLAGPVHVRGGRVDYRRACFVRDADGRLTVEPLKDQGSAMLRTVTEAEALIAVGPKADYAAGEPVETIPLALLD